MKKDIIKGRAVYVLELIVLLNAIYPITSNGTVVALSLVPQWLFLLAGSAVLKLF